MSFFKPIGPLLRGWLWSFFGWGVLVAIISWQLSRVIPAEWSGIIVMVGRDCLAWAFLTPLVVRLVGRFPLERHTLRKSVPLHLVVGFAVLIGFGWMSHDRGPRRGPHPPDREEPHPPSMGIVGWIFLGPNLPIYLAILFGAHAAYFYEGRRERDRRALELAALLAEARLQALRAQIQPHFLFNSLNALGGLIRKDVEASDDMLVALSDFLRMTLAGAAEQELTLERELEYASRYLEIEKIRFGDRLSFTISADADVMSAMVPTLVLQPLVENAVRHGIEASREGGRIRIEAAPRGVRLRVAVSDDGPGLKENPPTEGVGITNSRARLRQLYGDAAELRWISDGGTTVELWLPFRKRS